MAKRDKKHRNPYVVAMLKRHGAGAGRHKAKRDGRGGAKNRDREFREEL